MSARRFPPLRRRLFFAIVVIVVVSIGVTFAVGVALSRRAVERANLDDLAHQADLISQRESQSDVLLPFSRLERLQPFLEKQNQQIKIVDLDAAVGVPRGRAPHRRSRSAARGGHDHGRRRDVSSSRPATFRAGLRPASSEDPSFADWQPFLLALLIAGAIAAVLAAIGSFLTARAIARPVRRVAEASHSLAAGVSPDPVPVEGSTELALLATSFNEMAEQLQRAKEAERNFLLSVSHELKTPLTAIRGYAEGLEDGAFTAEEAAATIREEARRLERLVRDLLDLARMNRREFAIHREQIDLGDVGREAVRRYEAEARAGGVELDAIAPDGAPALGDPDRVLQVVSNLVENALRSTPPGGSVHVRARPGVIEVVDTGVGLAPEDVPHAFERFYLHDRVGIPDGARWSSGLGLAIVKELCERMGGLVTLESTLGEGTTFTVRLPGPTPAPRRVGDTLRAHGAP